ncbi:MAG: flagellar biosynthesis protein FliQ [gamma proteobacterium endosymbiont of Lamellibrachia anaximandri]|uniref:Flagellar biosynthetic protein FliQ n=1 Tax=endosymbiont of Escarpia spicata TaxID=2200908 RepID=A0A370DRY9_9GAMM|nr:flagellar biosynthesis protein FliQ [endosymbiont of Lamellibrachia barhami]MBA1445641.1 flagellar biosynthesis protein FliQ [Gammaproteobacteria bacterium]MBL3528611.1 flagellar biosynthesis protein FliQ [gamma proteobacterium endosymbiont of Lamellibrachia anaximandri]QYZ65072.1 MAG: flagellar biosynthesis protein FliQ [Gammaproteobacteria bacterium (ex Lamellibrachia satsuma)]RDH87199.1 MAG: flagellar biosynthetic protein FliQ [endosymbiont of Escarpia spicata]RLJ21214.1 MAG: flagellar b
MGPDTIIAIGQQTLGVIGVLTGMVLLPALAVGLLVAMFQAATQINEMTLTFIPKLAIVGLILMFAGPWMLQLLMTFAQNLIESIPELIQ